APPRLSCDAETVEQAFEARVVAVVEDDEAGVDPVRRVRRVDPDRVRMAARARRRLEDDDLVPLVQQVRGDEAGHAGADDRDPHLARAPIASVSAARRPADPAGAEAAASAPRRPGARRDRRAPGAGGSGGNAL